ncbi:MAG TPA: UDP-N-acetylmuramate--L-alanine ligase [Longimicrobiales bacterium]|nr:UDP-N-acetylmuramate--L-alanine ligase [Longimicrobiales bacterium]
MTARRDEAWLSVDLRALSRSGAVHFMGVSGSGMSALAELIVRGGGTVSGCDLRLGAAADALRARGVTIHHGHDTAHVSDAAALVMTSAIPASHPEVIAARERGIPVLKRAQALGALVNRASVLAIAGTHGKTTTTAATTAILDAAGMDPTGLVGGRMPGWGGGLRAGRDEIFVVEADEYDRSFLTLQPTAAVITSIEADHLDIYGDLAGVERAFLEFAGQVKQDGIIAICADDEGGRRIAAQISGPAQVLTYGIEEGAELLAVNVRQDGRVMTFDVVEHGARLGTLTLGAPGLHNVLNALGAFAVARHAGATFESARTALPSFSGVSRRFQELGSARGVTIVDDYAHHPTEIAATIATARGTYPGRRIVAAFQPHLYSRTRDHAAEFGRALARADVVWVSDVYPAREAPIEGVSGELVSRAAQSAGNATVRYATTLDEMARALRDELQENDVLVAMGAGDIDEMAHGLYESLAQGAA